MNVSAASSLNALVQLGLESQQQPAKPAAAHVQAPAAAVSDGDGDNDGSRVGTQLNVKA
jgi:hypothetical protein